MFRQRVLPTLLLLLLATGWAQQIEVQPGDTLWALANRYDTTVEALIETNLLAGDRLRPGMLLTLPSGSESHPASYTVNAGDTLYDISLAFDVSVDDLIALNDLDGTVIRPGQVLQLLSETPPAPLLVVTVEPGDSLWAIAREHDSSVAAIIQANSLGESATIRPGDQLTIPGRYAGTGQDQGGPSPLSIAVTPGDTLWSIARRYDTTVATLMSANELRGDALRVGQTLRIVPGSEVVRAQSSEDDPVPSTSAALIWPLQGPITSRFGYRRLRIGGSNMHSGIDIDGASGDAIRAATTGQVTFSGWKGGYGNLVIIQTGNTEYYYAHASELLVREGQQVAVGDLIARVGSTGRSTGSHLHFEIRVDGTPVDPLPLLEAQAQR